MFKEILKILPRLDNNDVNKMERTLTQRFTRIAKKFGKGMSASLLGGGVAGAVLGIVDKILNPLKEVQEAIDKTLMSADDIATNAEQFGTSAGKLLKLQTFAKAKGLDASSLYMLIGKFQTAVAEAEADPKKPSSVRNFVGIPDTSDAFFEFIQSLKRMSPNEKVLVQSQVFGEKQILKMSEFLNANFDSLNRELRLGTADDAGRKIEKLGSLSDLSDRLTAQRDYDDMLRKSSVINKGMVLSRDQQLRNELNKENMRIQSYQDLMKVSQTADKILFLIENNGMKLLAKAVTAVEKIAEWVQKLSGFRLLKGMISGGE